LIIDKQKKKKNPQKTKMTGLLRAVADIGEKKKFRIPMADPDIRALAQADWERSAADADQRQPGLGIFTTSRAASWLSRVRAKSKKGENGVKDFEGDIFYD
jgi:hypothetical protein